PEGRCERETTPGRERDRFSPDEHERVYAFVVLQDLEPARSYEISARWYGPDGGVAARATKRLIVPQAAKPSFTIELYFWSAAKTLKPGRWRVEITINGDVEANRAFEVIGSTRAQRLHDNDRPRGTPLDARGRLLTPVAKRAD